MNKLLKPLELAIVGFGWVARAAVLALVLMVDCNVLLRYAFSWSPVAAQEFEWHLISPIALLGMAYAVYHRADVRVTLVLTDLLARTLPDLRGPVSGLWGADDALYRGRHEVIRRALATAPDFRGLQFIAGAGHWVHADQPEALLAAVNAFLTNSALQRTTAP